MKTERLTSYPQNFTWPNRIYKIKDDTKKFHRKRKESYSNKVDKAFFENEILNK